MNKLSLSFLAVIILLLSASIVWAYAEGPSNSGNWVYGKIDYSDGSLCGNCCRISIETDCGFSEEGCANEYGEYKIYVSSKWVRAVYFQGSKVWDNYGDSKDATGGLRIDIRAK